VADVVFAIPGELSTRTGGYGYDRRVLALLPACGLSAWHLELPCTFPTPSQADLELTHRLFEAAPPGCVLLVDGLAYGVLSPAFITGLGRPTVPIVHHPLCFEGGLAAERRSDLFGSERAALACAARVVVTSRRTRRTLVQHFEVPDAKIAVAEPGTDAAPRASGTGSPIQILSVGSVVPHKGFDILIEALAPLRDLDWQLTIAGHLDRSPATVVAVRAAINAARLERRVTLTGSLRDAALAKLYAAADLFVFPSLLEGYGMVLAEAMARGLPVVCTTGCAAAESMPEDSLVQVPAGNAEALSAAVAELIVQREKRAALAEASWAAAQTLPRWHTTAQRIAAVLCELRS
jgi:glycosyltransferase involved in cell wall biosynthesis